MPPSLEPLFQHLLRRVRTLRPRLDLGTARSAWALVGGLGAVVFVLSFVNERYPLRHWFALPLGAVLGRQALLNLAWVGFGLTITRRILPASLPALERLVIGVAAGVLSFAFSLYLLGVMGLFVPAAALGLALGFALAGLPELVRWVRQQLEASPPPPSRTVWGRALPVVAAIIGVCCTAIIYLGLLAPDTINYDARWWHLSISEGYVREGRMIRFPGNWVNSYPHLASILHTWDFLIPGLGGVPARFMMVLHTEFSLFLWTLVGVAAVVRWLVDDQGLRGAWAALFLFPGVFIYDGNIGGSADHAMAFFVLPLFLLTVRLPGQPSLRPYALWGALAAGALLTKLHAVYVLVPFTLLLAGSTLRSAGSVREGAARTLRAGAYALAAFLVVTAPHFGTNLAYHANPFYPLLQNVFTGSHPTVPDAPVLVRELLMDWNWKPSGGLATRLRDALALMFTFSFQPHYSFTNGLPVFGFAFTLALPLLLAVRGARRLWVAALVSLGALFCWANTVRVDRNLQTFMPLLAATTAAILVAAWRSGRLARIGVGALVLSQLVWAGDLWFGGSASTGIALIRSGLDGRGATRFADVSADYVALERALPKKAVVFLHHWHLSLGINRPVFLDWVGFQGSIDYRAYATARDFYDRLRALGVTHVVHLPGNQMAPSKQEDAIFQSLTLGYGGPKQRFGMFEMYPLPETPPPQRAPIKVLVAGLPPYADGLYDVSALGVCHNLPAHLQHYPPPSVSASVGFGSLIDAADVLLTASGAALDPVATERLAREFHAAVPYPGLAVYVRMPPRS